jgi:hypothetical protein
MKKYQALKNEFGMSMIQVMIAAGIAAGIALMLAKVTQNSQKEVKRIEARNEVNRVHNNIMSALKDEASCTFLLRDLAIDEITDIPSIDFAANPAGGTALPQIYRCRSNKTEDWVGNGTIPDEVREVYCDDAIAGNPQTIYRLGFNESNADGSDASDFGALRLQDIKLYRNANQGNRVEVMVNYFVHGSVDAGGKQRASGVSNIVKRFPVQVNEMEAVTAATAAAWNAANPTEPAITGHPLNTGSMVRCNFDDIDFINTAVERSCIGNAALLTQDNNGRNICLHEMRIPNCDDGEVLVYKGADDHVLDSVTPNPSNENENGPVLRCAKMDLQCPNEPDTTRNFLPIAIQVGTGPHAAEDIVGDTNATDGAGDEGEFQLECLEVPDCDTNGDGKLDPGEGELVWRVNGTNSGSWQCLQRRCPDNQVGIYTKNGFECVSCSNGSGGGLIHINSAGNLDCVEDCPNGTVVVKANGGFQCKAPVCPSLADRFIGFKANGDPDCVPMFNLCGNNNLNLADTENVAAAADQNYSSTNLRKRITNIKMDANGTLKAECCDQNCSAAPNYCAGDTFQDPSGCGYCVGSKMPQNKKWELGNFLDVSEGREPRGCDARFGGCTEDDFTATGKVCRGKDGGTIRHTQDCGTDSIQCGGFDECEGAPSRIRNIVCSPAFETRGIITSSQDLNFLGYPVRGTIKFITVGAGGGGAGAWTP